MYEKYIHVWMEIRVSPEESFAVTDQQFQRTVVFHLMFFCASCPSSFLAPTGRVSGSQRPKSAALFWTFIQINLSAALVNVSFSEN